MKTPERSPSASNSATRVLSLLSPSNRVHAQANEPSSGTASASSGNAETRRRRWSLRRRVSKGDRKPEDSDNGPAPSPTTPIELVADTGPVELPSELDTEPDVPADYPIWAECNEITRVLSTIGKNLGRLQFLHQKSLNDPDTRPDTAINTECYELSCNTMQLCRRTVMRLKEIAYSPASAGFRLIMTESSRTLLRSIEHFRNSEEDYSDKLRGQMIACYKIVVPEASEMEALAVLNHPDQMGFAAFRLSADDRVRNAAQTISDRHTTIREVKEKIVELTGFLQDIEQLSVTVLERPRVNQTSEEGRTNVYESRIDSDGDIILDFGSGDINYSRLQYQVSSHMLSKTSPLFAQALKIAPSRTPGSFVPKGMEGQLPVVPPVRVQAKSATMVFMPQKEHNIGALGIVLCAAHMRNDKVPRTISFRELVEVARVCQQYHCIDPVSLFVELLWLPQWQEWIGHPGYGDFLLISYVFGRARIFETTSKKVILQLRGEQDVMEDKMLPLHVRERLRQVRAAILARIIECCRRTMRQYLPPPPLPEPSRLDGADWSSPNNRWVAGPPLESRLHCAKMNRQCDANNLGWLMLIFNELGILGSVMDSNLNLAQGTWYTGSLDGLFAKLCAVPSAAKVHDGDCDYAPAFRTKICEIFNKIKGLDLSEVNENYPERKRSSGVFGEVPRTTDALSRRSSYIDPDEENAVPTTAAPDNSEHEGPMTGGDNLHSADGNRLPAISRNNSDRSNETLSNGAVLQTSDAETHSIASTEITIPTERPNSPSPSISTLGTMPSGIVTPIRQEQASMPAILNLAAEVDPEVATSDRRWRRGTQEDEKIYWTHKAAKEIVKVEEKELIISHKHTIRIGEERGLPPIRDAHQVPGNASNPI
ncbi:hypothetical protein GP486_004772 [Trichoglossum hirsutum]|uniref:BTB domain-containing protein n=1 Tax=Trichoglossum hirsutum TaxID=265104 RepID=A0A9P8LAI3_9PEZI|nr:hypothetical protein GP486_004772 [Trichoglossum hirsutum]